MNKQSGFTLLELLVAMTITLILVAAALGAFTNVIRVNETITLAADMDQNLRAGMNLMIRDLMQAGSGIPTGGVPIPNGPGAQAVNRPAPVPTTFTFAGPPVTNWNTLDNVMPGAAMGPRVPFVNAAGAIVDGPLTDMVNILLSDSTITINQFPTGLAPSAGDPNPTRMADDGSTLTVDTNAPIVGIPNPVVPGDLILFQNPQGSALQAVTGVAGQTITFASGAPADPFNINQRGIAPSGTVLSIRPDNPACPFIPGTGVRNCWRVTSAQRVYLITYFMDRTIPRVPRLMRMINLNPARPVAEVIENLQLSYDMVTPGPPITDVKDPNVLAPPQAYSQIRKVNLYVAARSTRATSQRAYLRNNMTTQVSLRSAAFLNRYP